MTKTKKIYLDHAAATPIRPEVFRAMMPWLAEQFGNPSSITNLGVDARVAVERARMTMAELLGAHSDEIIFTSGGTESVNLALRGIMENTGLTHFLLHFSSELRNKHLMVGPKSAKVSNSSPAHLITSAIEHHAVLETAAALKGRSNQVTIVPVGAEGLIDPQTVIAAIQPTTRLVSLMLANNEIGTIQPIAEVVRQIRRANKQRAVEQLPPIYFHTDACQAAGYLNLAAIIHAGVDALSFNAGKIGGPKGVGALYLRRNTPLVAQITGGGQESGRRAGTENVAGIVGLARAFELAQAERIRESARISRLRDRILSVIQKAIPDVILNGHPTERLPNNLNLTIPGVEAEPLVIYLDQDGVTIGAGAACSNLTLEPSHVLRAIGRTSTEALSTIRITLGHTTTAADIHRAGTLINRRIHRLRATPQ